MPAYTDTAHMTARPLAAPGLTSYRCRSPFGWIMIGATDAADAMREAARSTTSPDRSTLEVWNGSRYVPARKARAMPLPVTYLRREPTTDATTLQLGSHIDPAKYLDVQSYRDPDAREKGMARWPWHYSQSKPTRRNRYVTLACMRHRIVWLPDLKP